MSTDGPTQSGLVAAPASGGASYKWWVVVMLWFVCFFNYADRQAISSVFPLLHREFGFEDWQLGLVGSAFMWVYAGVAPIAGVAADRLARKRLIVAACMVWSFFTLATAWAGNLTLLVAVRALTGLGETFYFPAAMALISDYHAGATRSRAMSWHQSAVYAGTILGSWMAAVLAERAGWRVPFMMFGPVGIVLALVLCRCLREPQRGAMADEERRPTEQLPARFASLSPRGTNGERAGERGSSTGKREGVEDASSPRPSPPEEEREKTCPTDTRSGETAEWRPPTATLPVAETIKVILRTPAAWLLMGAFLCANFVATIFLVWTPKFLVDKFGFKLGVAGLTGTVYIHLASALMVPAAGWLADRLSRRRAWGRMGVQAAGLVLGSGFVFLVGTTSSRTTLVLVMVLFGLCKGLYDSGIFASLYDVIDPRARGTAAGLMNTIGWGGGAMGPLFVGFASRYGRRPTPVENMSDAFAFGGLFYLAAAACLAGAMFAVSRQPRSGNSTGAA